MQNLPAPGSLCRICATPVTESVHSIPQDCHQRRLRISPRPCLRLGPSPSAGSAPGPALRLGPPLSAGLAPACSWLGPHPSAGSAPALPSARFTFVRRISPGLALSSANPCPQDQPRTRPAGSVPTPPHRPRSHPTKNAPLLFRSGACMILPYWRPMPSSLSSMLAPEP